VLVLVLVAPAGAAAATANDSMHSAAPGTANLRSLRLNTCANLRIGTSGSAIGTL